jgi:hypothetical protein
MCIIILSHDGNLPDKDMLRTAYENNPDGFGVMWVDNGRVQTKHGLFTFDQVWESLEDLEGIPWSMHLRYVTRGKRVVTQCHPFEVSSKRQSGRDIWMMHNGTFMFLNERVKAYGGLKSDTEVFANYLAEILRSKQNPDKVLFSSQVQENMKKKVESFNKMVFLTDEGRFEVFNEEGGVWLDNDMWASNTYSFQDGYREPVYKTPAARELDRFLLAQNKSTKKTTRSADKVVVDSPFKGYVTRNERKGRIEASSKSNVIYDPRFKWNALG